MTKQLELGELLKANGTAQVLSHNQEYKERFFHEADWLLRLHGEITSEDVVARIGMPAGHPNAVGAVMRAFAAQNKLEVREYRKSSRPSCHAAVIAVWSKL